jgi:hypothetical protein
MRTLRTRALACLAASLLLGSPSAAQSSVEKLTFYGYINQAYGVSSAQPILGLNKDATGDYRAAAMQVRYALTPNDNFVVQAGSRSLGTNPNTSAPGTVKLDWAFYHHRFDYASVRVGRVPVPFGFLSETRDVGTLLPFYRAPASYYLESYRSMDGGMLTNEVAFAGGSLQTDLFAGGTNGNEVTWTPDFVVVTPLRLERLIGGNVVYNTPIDGLRLRGSLSSLRTLDTATAQSSTPTKVVVLSGGAEAQYERAMFRGEARRLKIGSSTRTYSTYLQAGARVIDKLWLNGQVDLGTDQEFVGALNKYVGRSTADRALGAAYHFSSNIVAKVEQHFATGGTDSYVPDGVTLPYTNYSIASVAISF